MAILMCQSLQCMSQAVVEVQSVVVVGEGQDAIFHCNSLIALSIEWLINGTSLNSLQLSDVDQDFDSIASTGALRFRNVQLKYNGTIVQCIVHTSFNETIKAQNSTLLLQGTLSAVGDLEVSGVNYSTVFLNWTAPFTLNISFSRIDIRYCVDVVSSTSSATLHSECGITETEFTYLLPSRSWCDEYNFTVTPQNVVGNGTRIKYRSYISQALLIPERIVQVIHFSSFYTIVMSAPVCTASLRCVDLDDAKGTISIESADLNITEALITLTALQLNPNRRYGINITASNVRGTAKTSETYQLISTHDVRNVMIIEERGIINIEISYFKHSAESGALLIFIHSDPERYYLVLQCNISSNHTRLHAGRYRVFVYDVESDGTLASGIGYPAVNYEVIINGTAPDLSDQLPHYHLLKNCVISTFGYVAVVECAYPINSPAIGFQVIVQQIESFETGKLYLCQTRSRQTIASVVIEENGLFRVSVLAIGRQGGIINFNIEYTEWVTINGLTATTDSAIVISVTPTLNTVGLKVGLGLLSFLFVAVSAIVVVQFLVLYFKRCKPNHVRSNQLSLDSHSRTGSQLPEDASEAVPAPAALVDPQYEEVDYFRKKSEEYKVTVCAAYGLPLSR